MSLIKVDIDQPWESFDTVKFNEKLHFMAQILSFNYVQVRFNRSAGGNTHARIEVPGRLGPYEIVALQALLGSDWRREVLNLRRIRAGQTNWNVLFNQHEKVEEKQENGNNT